MSWIYRCNGNLSCRRCYCKAADKALTIVAAATTGNTLRKVGNGGQSGLYPRKTVCPPGCHLAPCFSPSLTQSVGKANKILGAISWHYTTLFSSQTLLSSPQTLCRSDVFPRTSGSHQRLLKQSCDKWATDTGSYRDVFLSEGCHRWSVWEISFHYARTERK